MRYNNYHNEITHWTKKGIDEFGKVTYNTPAVIIGRWEFKNMLFLDGMGTQQTSKSVVYLAGGSISLEDYLYLGNSTQDTPYKQAGSVKIEGVHRIPDLKNTSSLYIVFCI